MRIPYTKTLMASLAVASGMSSFAAQATVLINEVDADQTGTDAAEFIELYNDSASPVALDGYRVVLFNGSSDQCYTVVSLDGQTIAANGYFVIGSSNVSPRDLTFSGTTDQVQNGADAVALYSAGSFTCSSSSGNAVTTTDLVDALVYDTSDADDSGLLVLLNASQPQVDENADASAATVSMQRTPDGEGGARNTTGFALAAPTVGAANGATIVEPEFKRIYEIQAAAHVSPLNGQTVQTRGIVTATFTVSSSNKGFYIQDPDGDADSTTSDGLLVFLGSATLSVSVGDEVLVTGAVSEFRPGGSGGTNNLTITELSGVTVETPSDVLFTNTSVAPTVIGASGRAFPTDVVDDDTQGSVEVAAETSYDPASDGIDFYESLEGMLITVNNGVAVGPTTNFGEVWLVPDGGAGSTGTNLRGGISLTEYAPGLIDYNPERIQIDDDYFGAGTMPQVNTGDSVDSVTGVVGYSFGQFEVFPATAPSFTDNGLTPDVATVSTGRDRLTIANYNVENLDPNDSDTNASASGCPDADIADGKFAAIAAQIVDNLGAPDILALQEVQDDSGCVDDGVTTAGLTLSTLTDAIIAAGGPSYASTVVDPANDADGGLPGGNIRVAYLYNASRVSLVSGTLGAGDADSATAPTVDGDSKLALTLSPGRVDPTNTAWDASRKPLAAVFEFQGERVLVVNNHWSSKGGGTPIYGRYQPFVNGSVEQREQQAAVVNDFVDQVLAVDAGAKVVVLGDLNEFSQVSPLAILRGDSPDANVVLHDLVDEQLPTEERYSYNFEGNAQALDHLLVSPALAAVEVAAEVQPMHINSEFAEQVSDHDPNLASFLIEGVCTDTSELGFALTEYSLSETGQTTTVEVTVARSGLACGAATVGYQTVQQTATANVDYLSTSGTLSWAEGETGSRSFMVSVINDPLYEVKETFQLTLSAPSGAVLGSSSTATVSIKSNDDLPTVSLGSDLSSAEGTTVLVTATLNTVSGSDVAMNLVLGGSATYGEDYKLKGGANLKLTIPAGALSASKEIVLKNDDVADEDGETAVFTLSNVKKAAVGDTEMVITITDND